MFKDDILRLPKEFHRLPVQDFGGSGGTTSQDITTANGTFSHSNGTSEDDLLEFLLNDENIEVTLDCVNLTQTTTFRLYEKTDGTTYRLVDSVTYPTDFDGANVIFAMNGKGRDMKVTIQSSIAEGAARSIPHVRVEELRE